MRVLSGHDSGLFSPWCMGVEKSWVCSVPKSARRASWRQGGPAAPEEAPGAGASRGPRRTRAHCGRRPALGMQGLPPRYHPLPFSLSPLLLCIDWY